ncbi:MAG: hypothetical protein KC736_03955 [Candidatus Moranbacteria bacterium]|nr:hypothetical protein [Candidatus Moranbacteria bacterium]
MENRLNPDGEGKSHKKEWYKNWWGIIIALIIWPAFAIWYIVQKTKWKKVYKGLAIFGIIILAILVYGGDTSKTTPESNNSDIANIPNAQEIKESTTEPEVKVETEEEKRKKMIEDQFSVWDGSHIELTKIIKKSMNDPKSYEHVETTYTDMGDYLIVNTVFRGKNAFGALVKNTVKAKVSLDGKDVEILNQQ